MHAKWIGPNKTRVTALAVASEPYIFWRGDGAEEIIAKIHVPAGMGTLEKAGRNLNGPSGIALDERILSPMGLSREQAWLCDLVPHSCANPGQRDAVRDKYKPLAVEHGAPEATVPAVPKVLADERRQQEILDELRQSKAETLVLLGDKPIQWFLKRFDSRWNRLSDFESYGRLHPAQIDGIKLNILPLAHPRQVAGLGAHSDRWRGAHEKWTKAAAGALL